MMWQEYVAYIVWEVDGVKERSTLIESTWEDLSSKISNAIENSEGDVFLVSMEVTRKTASDQGEDELWTTN